MMPKAVHIWARQSRSGRSWTSTDLPLHDQRAADGGRRRLSRVDGHRRGLGPDAEPEEEPRDEHATIISLPSTFQRRTYCHHVFVKPCQKQASAEKKHVSQMVPRRPNQLFSGVVNQQPSTAQHRYGAELTSPISQVSRCDFLSPMPNCGP
jgi:hypothetical protein